MIDEAMDAALERRALEEGVSKAALIRRYIGEHLEPLPPIEEDPIWKLVGMFEGTGSDDSERVDEILYGPLETGE
jgi:hypothetical protein